MRLYCRQESAFHSLDARLKLLLFLSLFLLQVFLPLAYGLALSLAVAALYSFSRISLPATVGKYPFLLALPIMPALLRVLFEGGTAPVLGVALPAGAVHGAQNFLFLFSLAYLPLLFALTTPPSAISSALRFFCMPKRMAFLFSIAFLSVSHIAGKAERVLSAQRARGCERNALSVLLPVLHSCFRRSRSMALALCARGFDADSL